ncbi:MAG: TetR/AcrR family transcriptional regulator [Proteobacteria bacterium]|nr:TetR/AcrR family transcriptional regulator [Pseudomonadota bacterium]
MKKTAETRSVAAEPAETPATAPPKPRGRPLSFDRDAALERAMHVFWEHGYEAASISDLTSAMGISPPSLYSAFGDKERLFLEAIERYNQGPGGFGQRALTEEPTARGAIQRLLEDAAAELTRACHPLGCMMVMAATNCSVAAEHVQTALAKRRALGIASIESRIRRGVDDGELPPGADASALANFYATVYQGMSMQAKDGATYDSLMATAASAMRAWPVEVRTRVSTAKRAGRDDG